MPLRPADPAARDGPEVVAGAVLTGVTGAVVGVSDVFTTRGDPVRTWTGILAWTASHHPGLPSVGYETGDDLAVVVAAGFEAPAPLRVWVAVEPHDQPVVG